MLNLDGKLNCPENCRNDESYLIQLLIYSYLIYRKIIREEKQRLT